MASRQRSKGVFSLRSRLLLLGPGASEVRRGVNLSFNGILKGSKTIRGNELFYALEAWKEMTVSDLGSRYFRSPPTTTPPSVVAAAPEVTKTRRRPTKVTTVKVLERPTPEMFLKSRLTLGGGGVISRRNISVPEGSMMTGAADRIFAAERKLILDERTKEAVLEFCSVQGDSLTRFMYRKDTPDAERVESRRLEKLLSTPQTLERVQRKVLFLLSSAEGKLNGVAIVIIQSPNSLSVNPSGKPRRLSAEEWEAKKEVVRKSTFAELLCVSKSDLQAHTQNLLEGVRQVLVEEGYTTLFVNASDVFANDFKRELKFDEVPLRRARSGAVRMSRDLVDAPIVWPSITV